MKIVIDRMNCVSCGTCWDTCPDFFEENAEDSFSQITKKFRVDGNIAEGIPPGDLEDCAARAASDCCAEVIHVEEE
jgi:ferredoxin